MAKCKSQTYKKLSTGDAFSISVLARTIPEDRESVYRQIEFSLSPTARKIARKLLAAWRLQSL